MPQNPTRQVHALLGGFVQDALINNQNHHHKTDKIIARTLFFSKNEKLWLAKTLATKTKLAEQKHKLTRTLILENLTLPKNDNAKENEIILQTQLTWNFAIKRHADFESLQNRPRTEAKTTKQSQSKPMLTKAKAEKPWRWF